MADRIIQAVPAPRRRTAAEAAIDMALMARPQGTPLLATVPASPLANVQVAPALPNSPALAPAAVATAAASTAARQGSRDMAPARSKLFADRPAYRQTPLPNGTDDFPIAGAIANLFAGASRVMGDAPALQRDLMAAPAATKAAATGSGTRVLPTGAEAGAALTQAARGGALGPIGMGAAAVSAISNFLRGGSETDAIVTTPAAAGGGQAQLDAAIAERNSPARQAVAAVAPQGPLTPQDALSQILTTAFTNGVSFDELQGLGQLVPAAVKPVQSAKDRNAAVAAGIADKIFESAIAQAQALPDEAAKQAAMRSALQNYWSMYAGMDPLKQAQAALLANAQQE